MGGVVIKATIDGYDCVVLRRCHMELEVYTVWVYKYYSYHHSHHHHYVLNNYFYWNIQLKFRMMIIMITPKYRSIYKFFLLICTFFSFWNIGCFISHKCIKHCIFDIDVLWYLTGCYITLVGKNLGGPSPCLIINHY